MKIIWLGVLKNIFCSVHGAGFFTLICYLGLALYSHQSSIDIRIVLPVLIVLWVLLFSMYYFSPSENKININTLLFWAVAFRICALFSNPILEDDFYRYLWDGYQFAISGTPYAFAPQHFFISENISDIFVTILDHVNNPNIPTLYGPVTQYAFLLAYYLVPGKILGLKLVFLGADLLTLFVLKNMASKKMWMLYSWCPLIIYEIGFKPARGYYWCFISGDSTCLLSEREDFLCSCSAGFCGSG